MRKTYKIMLIAVLLIAVIAVALTGCAPEIGIDAVKNGAFSEIKVDEENKEYPVDWQQYTAEGTSAKFALDEHSQGDEFQAVGKYSVSVEVTNKSGVAHYRQKIKLYAGTTYRFSVYYKIENNISGGSKDAIGAYFGFVEDDEFLTLTYDGSAMNNYEKAEVYFTPSKTAKYTLSCGIGHEELGGMTGKVSFGNVSVTSVKAGDLPANTTVEKLRHSSNLSAEESAGIAYTVVLSLAGIAMLVGAYYLLRFINRKSGVGMLAVELADGGDNGANGGDKPKMSIRDKFNRENIKGTLTSPIAIFAYVLTGAFLLRFIFIVVLKGMPDIMTAYGKFAQDMAVDGIGVAAGADKIALPSGMLYLLTLLGLLGDTFALQPGQLGMNILLRMPNVVADIVACYLIFSLLNKNYNYKVSIVFAGLYALLPTFFNMSTSYGAGYSISLAFILGMVSYMIYKNHIGVIAMWSMAFLFSYDALILLPLLLGYEIYYCVIDHKEYKRSILPITISSAVALLVIYCLSLPFAHELLSGVGVQTGLQFPFTNMIDGIKANPLVTENTFNLYAIIGLGRDSKSAVTIALSAVLMVGLIALAIYSYLKGRNRVDFVYLAAMSFIAWTVLGVGANLETMIIGLVLLLTYTGLRNDKRLYCATGFMSVTAFINSAVLMTNSGVLIYGQKETAGLDIGMFAALDPLMIIGSICMVISVIYLVYVGFDIMVNNNVCNLRPMPENYGAELKASYRALRSKLMRKK